MFELSVACKYLLPRRRQLSVSIISLISVLVIALVVWLIVVFFSVTDGLEKNWVQKLTALTAPVRITPTDAYYQSYYYLIDTISEASGYATKSISEKLKTSIANPYEPELDEEIPAIWPAPDLNSDGTLKDLVKIVYSSLSDIKDVGGLYGHDFELTASQIQLKLIRPTSFQGTTQSVLTYPAFLGNFENTNPQLENTLLKLDNDGINNYFSLIGLANSHLEEESHERKFFDPDTLRTRLESFFNSVTIQELKTPPSGWTIPHRLLPKNARLAVCAALKGDEITRIYVSENEKPCPKLQNFLEEQGLSVIPGWLIADEGVLSLELNDGKKMKVNGSNITLEGEISFAAQLDKESFNQVKRSDQVLFDVKIPIQGLTFTGKVPFRGLKIVKAISSNENSPFWIHQPKGEKTFVLPKDDDIGEGVALPKSFKNAGVMVGDRGFLSYYSPTPSIIQEQRIPIYVAGFYDPGIIPIGGKYILANQEVTSLIRTSHSQEDKGGLTNGINVRFNDLKQADTIKNHMVNALKNHGISRYWNVETYRDYEFTKEIIQELQSQKNLFLLIAIVIIVVACSNIISMLIILVNDKKTEIGILRSMGASSTSIALIFGLAGAIIGIAGSLTGIIGAILTLHYLDTFVGLLSHLQGHEMFSANLYGQVLPHELSLEALSFVFIATICISLLAGIVPAIKASLLRPSQILRAAGG